MALSLKNEIIGLLEIEKIGGSLFTVLFNIQI